ncbi:MAG TPA: MG2 domain-containing protein, partial [Myxococcales bacterium]
MRRTGSLLPALAAAALFLAAAPARAAQLFLSTERPFAPDKPGAVVKLEVPGARSVDVRLYRLDDAERFFAAQADLRHVQDPALAPSKKGEGQRRAAGPVSQIGRSLSGAVLDARAALLSGFSPAARALAGAALDGPSGAARQALPFLRGLELVERWDLACGAGDAEFSYCDLDVGPRAAGAYLVEAVAGREVAHAVAIFSRLQLVARRTEGALAVLAVDGQTGTPMANVHLSVLPQGGAPLHGTTSRQGLLLLAKAPARPLRLVGTSGADVAVLELPAVFTPEAAPAALLLTDRGEYRPGERVSFHGFARSAEDKLALPRSERAELSAYDARGSLFWDGERPLSAQGGFGGELVLPPGLPEGLYRLVAKVEGGAAGAEFAVREAPEPAFFVEATLEAPGAGLPARAAVRASADGRPLSEAQFAWRAVRTSLGGEGPRSPEEIDRGELSAGPDGRATFSFDTLAGADARYEVTVLARDAAGRVGAAGAAATVVRAAERISLLAARKVVSPNEPVTVVVLARGEGDRPLALDLAARVSRSGAAGDGTKEQRVLEERLRTGPDGRASLGFVPTVPGYYEVELRRGEARVAETYLYVTASGGDIPFSPDTLVLVPDRASYAVGDTARVLVLAPFEAGTALLTVESDELVRHEALALRGASAVYAVKVTAALAPDFTLTAQAVVGERTWRAQRLLPVAPRGETLAVQGSLSPSGASPGALQLAVEVLDKAGRPAAGAELFAVVRDAAGVGASAPPLFAFFHPDRLSDGVTASSTGYRSSSSGRPFAKALLDEEGALPFKGLAQGRPRPREAGTLLSAAAVTDAKGRAVLAFSAPPSVARLAVDVRVASGPAMGEWSAVHDRAPTPLALSLPRFLRPGDEAQARVSAQAAGRTTAIELTCGAEAPARGADSATLALAGDGLERVLTARIEGLGTLSSRIAAAPAEDRQGSGLSGLAAGPGRLGLPAVAPPATLYVAGGPGAAAVAARRSMGTGLEPETSRATARVLARLAQWQATPEPEPALRAGALSDLAALVGLAHPEGVFGDYDGAPAQARATEEALLALALAREAGLPVEEGLLARGAERMKTARERTALASLALALLEELPEEGLAPLAEREAQGQLPGAADRASLAWALEASGQKAAAKEVAQRLEKSARPGPAGVCFAEACPSSDVPREAVRATALSALALRRILPKSPALAGALRFLLANRGAGDFGGDPTGGLAALAVAAAAESLPAYAGSASVEVAGKVVANLPRLSAETESRIELPAGALALNVSSGKGLVLWRLERSAPWPAGALKVERSWAGPGGDGEFVKVGERVEVT